MAVLVETCPRCSAEKMTLDILACKFIAENEFLRRRTTEYVIELCAACRHCKGCTVFILMTRDHPNMKKIMQPEFIASSDCVNNLCDVLKPITNADVTVPEVPNHLPPSIERVLLEGLTCQSVGCHNAAGSMFRLCVDLATKSMLPATGAEMSAKVKRNLGLRLEGLFESKMLPDSLRDLAMCIKDDGNDGVHDGTLASADVEDMRDFTIALLERLYTEPEKLRLANERRVARRGGESK